MGRGSVTEALLGLSEAPARKRGVNPIESLAAAAKSLPDLSESVAALCAAADNAETPELARAKRDLAEAASNSVLARYHPDQAARLGREDAAYEELFVADALALLQAARTAGLVPARGWAERTDLALTELLSATVRLMARRTPPERSARTRLQALLVDVGFDQVAFPVSASTGHQRTRHALAGDGLKTACGRFPDSRGWRDAHNRLPVSCGSCAKKLDRADRAPLDLDLLLSDLGADRHLTAVGSLLDELDHAEQPSFASAQEATCEQLLGNALYELIGRVLLDPEPAARKALLGKDKVRNDWQTRRELSRTIEDVCLASAIADQAKASQAALKAYFKANP